MCAYACALLHACVCVCIIMYVAIYVGARACMYYMDMCVVRSIVYYHYINLTFVCDVRP